MTMIQIGAKGTLKRLDEMLESAMNGTFDETSYDETELVASGSPVGNSNFTAQGQLVGQVKKERENIRTLVSDISHQTKTPLANICSMQSFWTRKQKMKKKDAGRADCKADGKASVSFAVSGKNVPA